MKITRAVLVLVALMLLISCSVPKVSITTDSAQDASTKKPAVEKPAADAGKDASAPGGDVVKPSSGSANANDLVKPTAESAKKPKSTLESVMAATVQLGVLDATWQQIGTCSGSIIDPRGLIITNFHCIGNNETGEFHNADGIDYVYMTLDPHNPPKLQFLAQTVDADAGKDIAVLRVIATTNGEPPADCLSLPAISLNTDEKIDIGTKVTSVGYPGVGGETLTIANGQVVGFDEYSMSGQGRTYPAIKYDASDSAGISGGPIIDENFQQVAIAHAGRSDAEKGGKLSLARPISLASDLINSSKLVRIPGCNGAAAAQLIGPATQGTADTATNGGNNSGNNGGDNGGNNGGNNGGDNGGNNGGDNGGTTEKTYEISGRVLDSVSKEPIANGYIIILKPEYKWADVNYDAIDSYIWVFGKTDSNGVYKLKVTDTMASQKVAYGMFAKGYNTWTGDAVDLMSIYNRDKNEWIDLYLDASAK